MFKKWLLLVVVLVLSLSTFGLSCSSEDDPNSEPSPPGARQILLAMCRVHDRCPQEGFPDGYRSIAECADIVEFSLTCSINFDFTSNQMTLTPRGFTVDPDAAQQCLDWLNNLQCTSDSFSGSNPCSNALILTEGTDDNEQSGAGEGESCEQLPCQEGFYCKYPDFDSNECAICEAPAAAGESCNEPTRPCEEGTQCNWEDGRCRALAGLGEDCAGRSCQEDLFCSFDTEWVCAEPLPNGEECDFHTWCESQFCNPETGLCTVGSEVGEACTNSGDCRYGFCDPQQDLCVALRTSGEECSEDSHCEIGNCDEGTNQCGFVDGENCSFHLECQSGFCDLNNDRTCQPAKSDGEACSDNHECQSRACDTWETGLCVPSCYDGESCGEGYFCEFNRLCRPQNANNLSCFEDRECLSGHCTFDGRCGDAPALGDQCSDNSDCPRRAHCHQSVCVERGAPGAECQGLDTCLQPYICLENTCTLIKLECRPAQIGERCTMGQVCETGARCNYFDNLTCVSRVAAGESCFQDAECLEGHHCDFSVNNGTCLPLSDVGESCEDNHCMPGLWCNDVESPATCAEKLEPGEECPRDEACDNAWCTVDGVCHGAPSCVMP